VDVDFPRAMDRCLAQISPGRVATCGTVARALGDPRAARAVATWLAEHPATPGAHRVVRADGRPILQEASDLLAEEGIRLAGNRVDPDFAVDHLEGIGFLDRLREEQVRLSGEVRQDPLPVRRLHRITGVDVSYRKNTMDAAAVSVDPSTLEPTEITTVRRHVDFPYIPSYLSYREFPGIREAVNGLAERPDLVMVDGHGLLHPARFGIACHAGLGLGLPTIGIAKHLLVGHVGRPLRHSGRMPVRIEGRTSGYAWIPPGRSRAIYVSVGHRVLLRQAMTIVRETTRSGYPEPLRVADRISRERNKG
jgi:deoxyribonuclease V